MTTDFTRQWTRTEPFGSPDWQMTYPPDRAAIATAAGVVVAEHLAPRATSRATLGRRLSFLLDEPGVQTTDIPSITLEGRTLRGLRMTFASVIHPLPDPGTVLR